MLEIIKERFSISPKLMREARLPNPKDVSLYKKFKGKCSSTVIFGR